MEGGDAGQGRDAYGPPRRPRGRRAFGPDGPGGQAHGPEGPGPDDRGYPGPGPGAPHGPGYPFPPGEWEEGDAVAAAAPGERGRGAEPGDDDFGQLLRRPGDIPPRNPRLRQPGRPRMRQPGPFRPADGAPSGGGPTDGPPVNGAQANGGQAYRGPGYGGSGYEAPGYEAPGYEAPGYGGSGYGTSAYGGPAYGGPAYGAPANGGPANGGPPGGAPANGGAANGGPMPGRQYHHRLPNGRRYPAGPDRMYRPPGPAGEAPGRNGQVPPQRPGAVPGSGPAAGNPHAYPGVPGTPGFPPQREHPGPAGPPPGAGPLGGGPLGAGPTGAGPTGAGPLGGGPGGAGPLGGGPGGAGAAGAGPRLDGFDGRERVGRPPGTGRLPYGAQEAMGTPGPVIRQRESAVSGERPEETGQPVASIAPDDLEAFARDLRTLRAKAGLDYPEMAEVSHFTMKTLVSAAGGLRLPTLPVAVAYVRACDGDVAEWEERWQKLAAKITAEAARKRKSDEEQQEPPEPTELSAVPEPPALGSPAAQPPEPEAGEIYVITSAKPRPPSH